MMWATRGLSIRVSHPQYYITKGTATAKYQQEVSMSGHITRQFFVAMTPGEIPGKHMEKLEQT